MSGFTIVELLIVIVVIAILAAISVVAYTGIQNLASDNAVQSDITNFSKKIMLYYAEHEVYPAGGDTSAPAGVGGLSLARGAYETNGTNNFYYCVGTASGNPAYAIGAISKSGNKFYYSSQTGSIKPYTGTWATASTSAQICPGMGLDAGFSFSYGYHRTNGWYSWTN